MIRPPRCANGELIKTRTPPEGEGRGLGSPWVGIVPQSEGRGDGGLRRAILNVLVYTHQTAEAGRGKPWQSVFTRTGALSDPELVGDTSRMQRGSLRAHGALTPPSLSAGPCPART